MSDSRVSSVSQFLSSDVFIVFVVVLLLLVAAISTICCVMRRRQTHTGTETAEIEIIPAGDLDRSNRFRFTLKIVTEQKHASELIRMFTGNAFLTAATEDVASTSGQPRQKFITCHHDTHNMLPTGQQVTTLELQTTQPIMPSAAAMKLPNPEFVVTDDDDDNDDDDISEYSTATS